MAEHVEIPAGSSPAAAASSRRGLRRALAGLTIVGALGAAGYLAYQFATRERALTDEQGRPYTAEQLFVQADGLLKEKDTLRCEFRGEAEGTGGPGTYHGAWTFADGNRLRLELEMETPQGRQKITLISDGSRLVGIADERAGMTLPRKERAVHPRLNREFLGRFATEGAAGILFNDIHSSLKPFDFVMGRKEEVDGRLAQVIEYRIHSHDDPQIAFVADRSPADADVVRLWIDTRTGLPLKRVQPLRPNSSEGGRVTEYYTRIERGTAVNFGDFVIPP